MQWYLCFGIGRKCQKHAWRCGCYDHFQGFQNHAAQRPENSDFTDLWLLCDYSDKHGTTSGGFCAIHMLNTLSTGGFSLQTGDKKKGQMSFEYTAHYSITAQDTVPCEVYIKAGEDEA